MLLALRRYAVSDTKRLAWGFDPIEKSRVNHASFMDLAPRQYLSYLIEISLFWKEIIIPPICDTH